MESYYTKEKIFNLVGVVLAFLFLFKGWHLTFHPIVIIAILAIREVTMTETRKKVLQLLFVLLLGVIFIGYFEFLSVILLASYVIYNIYLAASKEIEVTDISRLQTVLLACLLFLGYILQYQYFTIHYFEYVMLIFFTAFLIYNMYLSSTTYKYRNIAILGLIVFVLMSAHIYIINSRVLKDASLNRVIHELYDSRFIGADTKIAESSPDLERLDYLVVSRDLLYSVNSLQGVENFPNIWEVRLDGQDKLTSYEELAALDNLTSLRIYEPHPKFEIEDLPVLSNLEKLKYRDALTDVEIELSNFPNLKSLTFSEGLDAKNRVRDGSLTIDIRQNPLIETISIRSYTNNEIEIVGLKEAENLKEVSISYYNFKDESKLKQVEQYKEEIRKLRPDIKVR
ncbi:hypothetical protein PRVXH_001582 [Proteinivorax hydrogeniformans]|uniref:DUF4153 domain-containing protein n=1 Tax=Proteinivorax hydrogeniformans TaxID=1826727 RepID=A0AAU8HPW1_9FIRM